MPTSLDIDQWSTQLRKGLAELCVLAAVHRLGEAYGYQLVQFLTDHDGLQLTESTVYPLFAAAGTRGSSQRHLNAVTRRSTAAVLPNYRARQAVARNHARTLGGRRRQHSNNYAIQSLPGEVEP